MNPNISTISDDEAILFLAEAVKHKGTDASIRKATRNSTMIVLMLDAGLRVGEIVQLTRNMLVMFGEPVQAIAIAATMTKNKRARTIPLTDSCKKALQVMNAIIWQQDGCGFEDYAFYSHRPNHPLTTRQVERIVLGIAVRSINRPIHPHTLRHTFATRLMRKVSLPIIQKLLGHKFLSSTQVYTHPDQQDLQSAIETMNESTAKMKADRLSLPSGADSPNHSEAGRTDKDLC